MEAVERRTASTTMLTWTSPRVPVTAKPHHQMPHEQGCSAPQNPRSRTYLAADAALPLSGTKLPRKHQYVQTLDFSGAEQRCPLSTCGFLRPSMCPLQTTWMGQFHIGWPLEDHFTPTFLKITCGSNHSAALQAVQLVVECSMVTGHSHCSHESLSPSLFLSLHAALSHSSINHTTTRLFWWLFSHLKRS